MLGRTFGSEAAGGTGSSSEMDPDSAAELKRTAEEIARKNTNVIADIASEQKELDNMLRKLSKLVDKVACFPCSFRLRTHAPSFGTSQALLADLSKVVGQTALNTTLLNQVLVEQRARWFTSGAAAPACFARRWHRPKPVSLSADSCTAPFPRRPV